MRFLLSSSLFLFPTPLLARTLVQHLLLNACMFFFQFSLLPPLFLEGPFFLLVTAASWSFNVFFSRFPRSLSFPTRRRSRKSGKPPALQLIRPFHSMTPIFQSFFPLRFFSSSLPVPCVRSFFLLFSYYFVVVLYLAILVTAFEDDRGSAPRRGSPSLFLNMFFSPLNGAGHPKVCLFVSFLSLFGLLHQTSFSNALPL